MCNFCEDDIYFHYFIEGSSVHINLRNWVRKTFSDMEYANQWEESIFSTDQSEHFQMLNLSTNETREYFGLTNKSTFRCWICQPMRPENILDWPIRALSDVESVNQWEERLFPLDNGRTGLIRCWREHSFYDISISSTLHIESKWSLANRRQAILPSRIVLSSDWLVSLYHSRCEQYFSLFQYCFKLTWFLGNHREPIAAQLT